VKHDNEYDLAHRSAETLALQAAEYAMDQPETASALAAAAQVHATLALAAATLVASKKK